MSKFNGNPRAIVATIIDCEKLFTENMMVAYDHIRNADIAAGELSPEPPGYISFAAYMTRGKTPRKRPTATAAVNALPTSPTSPSATLTAIIKMPNKFSLDMTARNVLFSITQALIMISSNYYKHIIYSGDRSTVASYEAAIAADIDNITPILRLSSVVPASQYTKYEGYRNQEFLEWIKIQIDRVTNDNNNLPIDGDVITCLATHTLAVYNYIAHRLVMGTYGYSNKITQKDFWQVLCSFELLNSMSPIKLCDAAFIRSIHRNTDYKSHYDHSQTAKAGERKPSPTKAVSKAVQEPIELIEQIAQPDFTATDEPNEDYGDDEC